MNPYTYVLSKYADQQTGNVSALVQGLLQVGAALNPTTSANPVTYIREHLQELGVNSHAVAQVQNQLMALEQQWARGVR